MLLFLTLAVTASQLHWNTLCPDILDIKADECVLSVYSNINTYSKIPNAVYVHNILVFERSIMAVCLRIINLELVINVLQYWVVCIVAAITAPSMIYTGIYKISWTARLSFLFFNFSTTEYSKMNLSGMLYFYYALALEVCGLAWHFEIGLIFFSRCGATLLDWLVKFLAFFLFVCQSLYEKWRLFLENVTTTLGPRAFTLEEYAHLMDLFFWIQGVFYTILCCTGNFHFKIFHQHCENLFRGEVKIALSFYILANKW